MGTGAPGVATSVDVSSQEASSTVPFPPFESEIEADEKEVFSQIKRPRVRYDVEVVTKLVVYSGGCNLMHRIGELWMLTVLFLGIAWIVMEGAPLFFDRIGLAP